MHPQIQAAYERLQAGVAGGQGPQAWRILLLLRAQAVLYGRWAGARGDGHVHVRGTRAPPCDTLTYCTYDCM